MTDYMHTTAYRRGVAQAAADRLKAPPDDGMVDVSVATDGYGDRDYFKLCRTCSEVPGSGRCCHDRGDFTLIRIIGYVEDYPA